MGGVSSATSVVQLDTCILENITTKPRGYIIYSSPVTHACRGDMRARAHAKKKNNNKILQASVVQKMDSAIHRINLLPADSAISFPNTYPLDSDLSGG